MHPSRYRRAVAHSLASALLAGAWEPRAMLARAKAALRDPAWLADWRGLARHSRARSPELRHYHYAWVPKRAGGARLLESPKPRLKAIQRRVLSEILDRIPTHDAAHGFVRTRSVVTHA